MRSNSIKMLIFLLLFVSFLPVFSQNYNSYIIRFSSSEEIKRIKDVFTLQNIHLSPVFNYDIDKPLKENTALSNDIFDQLQDLKKYYLIDKASAKDDRIRKMIENGTIDHIEPNYIFNIENDQLKPPNDPKYDQQWALKMLGAEKAWEKATGEGIVIGVIDTGIDYLHPDLVNQLHINEKEDLNNNGKLDPWSSDEFKGGITGDFNGVDDDGNGIADDVIGYDFVDQFDANLGDHLQQDAEPFDEMGHGTQVSGLIAAEKNNDEGIVGLAYDAKILTVRAFDFTGNAESDDIANSIVYAALNGADIINMSFGEGVNAKIVQSAVKLASSLGCVMVSSAGNSGWNRPHYPSDYDEVLSLGTVLESGDRDGQSNWGDRLDLMAPGTGVITTNFLNEYKTVGGTSFAAPYTAATAALLLQMDPSLQQKEIYGILQQTSENIDPFVWNPYIGAGLLNAKNAVNFTGKTIIDISYPPNDHYHDITKTDHLPVVGTVAVPFFKSYQLFIGKGISPENWTELTNIRTSQIMNDTITEINLNFYSEELYTIRLLCTLNNNRTLEKRNRLYLPHNSDALKILSVKALNILHNENNAIVVGVKANRANLTEIKYRPEGSSKEYTTVSDNFYYEHLHTVLLDQPIEPGVKMEAIALAITGDGQVAESEFTFTLDPEPMPVSGFAPKDHDLPISYLLNEVADIYDNGGQSFVVNDISGATWNSTNVYQYDNDEFKKTDSLNSIWIPIGLGDSNGDGITEVLTTANRKTKLTQAAFPGGSPFTKILYSDTISAKFWAAAFYDLDKDGREDIIGYNDTSFFAVSYKNGTYSLLAFADMKDEYSSIGSFPGAALGDFDNDGKTELIHGNQKSHLFVWEYANGDFHLEKIDSNETSSYTPIYMTECDIEGDGTPEILMANYGTAEIMGQHEGGTPVWLCRVIKYDGTDLNTIWKKYAWGVKSGTTLSGLSYRNGVAAGNIDDEPGDEIIFSPFPNYYVFKWDRDTEKMEPMWWYPSAYSNSALIHDFDGNNINEMGFTTTRGTFFYEYDKDFSGPKAPTGFDGWALNESSAYFEWNSVMNADGYELFRVIRDEGGVNLVSAGITQETNITISDLENETWYEYTLAAFNNSTPDKYSEATYSIDIYTHKPITPVSTVVQSNSILYLNFDGKIPQSNIDPSYFLISKDDDSFNPIEAVQATDTSLVLSFADVLKPGEYLLYVSSFRDLYNTPTNENTLPFEIEDAPAPDEELYLSHLEVMSGNELVLWYSEPVLKTDAERIENYLLSPYGSIDQVILDEAEPERAIIIPGSDLGIGPRGLNYTITVKNVTAVSGNQMTTGAGNTLSFVMTSEDAGNAYVYPNPIKMSEQPDIYFANLPPRAEVIIYSLEGEQLRILQETDSNGGVEWDGMDSSGNELPSGIYLFEVRTLHEDGSSSISDLKKFAIIK